MPSQLLQFRFTDLPIELQREIFIVSGREHMGSATRLVRVSRMAYNWCGNPCQTCQLLLTFDPRRPFKGLSTHLQYGDTGVRRYRIIHAHTLL